MYGLRYGAGVITGGASGSGLEGSEEREREEERNKLLELAFLGESSTAWDEC